jgi:hypothetical protein
MFWSMVGQASFQTAREIGPSTIDRSKRAAGRIGAVRGRAPLPAGRFFKGAGPMIARTWHRAAAGYSLDKAMMLPSGSLSHAILILPAPATCTSPLRVVSGRS